MSDRENGQAGDQQEGEADGQKAFFAEIGKAFDIEIGRDHGDQGRRRVEVAVHLLGGAEAVNIDVGGQHDISVKGQHVQGKDQGHPEEAFVLEHHAQLAKNAPEAAFVAAAHGQALFKKQREDKAHYAEGEEQLEHAAPIGDEQYPAAQDRRHDGADAG